MTQKNGTIVVTGYPYALERYRKVFEFLPYRKEQYLFILPRIWKTKTVVRVPEHDNVILVRAWSYGRSSLLGGPFKGLTPGIVVPLFRLWLSRSKLVLYSCLEPNLLSTLYNGICARIFGIRHVLFTWQNVASRERSRGMKRTISDLIVRLNLFLADGIICGNGKAATIIRSYDAAIPLIICPLSGVDTKAFYPGVEGDWKRRLGIPEYAPVILFAGVLDRRKGLDVLVRACAELRINPRPILLVVGKGSGRQKLELLAEELGMRDYIRFLDWIDHAELPALMNCATVFAYPSVPFGGWEEQFGYSMAEASACGIPVVATRTGSIKEVIKDGETGILVPPHDAAALASALMKILSNKEIGEKMGIRGREHIISHFSHREIAGKISGFLAGF